MNFKCGYCDYQGENKKSKIKSVNIETDTYLKDGDKGRYYHRDCYITAMTTKKRNPMTLEEAKMNADRLVSIAEENKKEIQNRNKFYQWIMDFYDTSLPSYFCTKVSNIRNGTYEKVNEPIEYDVLLDIYEHMKRYLIKQSSKNPINNIGQRMNYDLAIVLGNYGNYKRYIEKRKLEKEDVENIKDVIKDSKKIKTVQKNKEEDNFNLLDDIEDLLI